MAVAVAQHLEHRVERELHLGRQRVVLGHALVHILEQTMQQGLRALLAPAHGFHAGDQEETAARRQAEAALLRERNPELWMARQLHDTAVTERTTAILTAMRQRPLHVRLRSLTSSRDGNLGV